MKHALVVGATGVIGGAMARRLISQPDWRVTCATRAGQAPRGGQGLAVDLLDARAVAAAGRGLEPVTHLFFAAYQPRPSRLEEVEPNLALLRHAIDLAEASGHQLQHVVLVTGGKYYGLQWGAIKTPARETDPRNLGPNFYYQQQDHLTERAARAGWGWTHLIPPFVTGLAERAPMNLVMALAVLATLAREAGQPLRFPGPAAAWNAWHHIADADQIAAAAAWAASSPEAAGQIFNIANGDPARWCHTWPAIARHFGLDSGEPLQLPLPQVASGLQDCWRAIAQRHGLRQPDLMALVDWNWAGYMFNTAFSNDVVFELGKIRRAGFHDCVDTEARLCGRFDELHAMHLIPPWSGGPKQ